MKYYPVPEDCSVGNSLAAISAELADKAEALETTFKVPNNQR